MFEDRLLIRQFKCGSEDAFGSIYTKYKNYLLTVAVALLNDVDAAEDIVHSVFIAFAESIDRFELNGSLKRYLAICVANKARNLNKAAMKRSLRETTSQSEHLVFASSEPERSVMLSEELLRISDAISKLPYDQREVVILRLNGGMKFKEIAHLQNESINTVQSKYRYGLNKLRSLLDDKGVTQ
jgi:RNA polymerase sigma-70 factor (ECF subfamily)